jgi:hypothetical protein
MATSFRRITAASSRLQAPGRRRLSAVSLPHTPLSMPTNVWCAHPCVYPLSGPCVLVEHIGARAQLCHSSVPQQCPARADARHLIKMSPSKGLVRKQVAPAFIARARLISTGKAVMKMNGTQCPWARRWACSSTPVIPGIRTSAITHDVPRRWSDRKNSVADANGWTMYPSDLTRLQVAARTDSSSSMIEITGSSDTAVFPDGANREPMQHSRWV